MSGLLQTLSRSVDVMLPKEIHEDIETLRRARILVGINLTFLLSALASLFVFWGSPWRSGVWLTPAVGCILACISALMLWWKQNTRVPAMLSSLGVCLLVVPLLYPVGGLQSRSVYWAALLPLLGMFLLGRAWGALCVGVSLLGLLGLYLAPSMGFPMPPPKYIADRGLLIILTFYYGSVLALGWLFESSRQRALLSLADSMAEAKEMTLAKETAESVSQAKSAFLARMSHELRTPLNAIIGYTEIIDEDVDEMSEEEIRADVRKIHSSGKHLLLLIEDLLDLARIEEGKMERHMEWVALSPILKQLQQELAPKLLASGNELKIQSLEHPKENTQTLPSQLYTDRRKLRQCLLNLLDNACKFTKAGTIYLTMELEREEAITFRVRDTGVGIPAEQQQTIFDRFVQGDDSPTRRFEGSGLGLYLTKDFVEMLGGTIGVESHNSQGSTFWFTIPLQMQMEPTPDESA